MMGVDFNFIPPGSGFRVPGQYTEFRAGRSQGFERLYRAVIFAQVLQGAAAPLNIPTQVTSLSDAAQQFGRGSHAYGMTARYFAANVENQPLYVVPLADPAGTEGRARATIDFAGTAVLGNGMVHLGIGGYPVAANAWVGDTASALALRVSQTIAANPDLPVWSRTNFIGSVTVDNPGAGYTSPPTVAGPAGTRFAALLSGGAISAILILDEGLNLPNATYPLTITGDGVGGAATATVNRTAVRLEAKNAGDLGNDLILQLNPAGRTGNQVLPAGVLIGLAPFSGGAGVPSLSAALAALADEPWDWWAHGYSDDTSLDLIESELASRWGWNRRAYALAFCARRGTLSELTTFGVSRNSPHQSVWGEPRAGSASPVWEIAASILGNAARSLSRMASQPLTTMTLPGIAVPGNTGRWTISERNMLYFSGISAGVVRAGVYSLDRVVTSYQKNELDQPDPSYLDVNTGACLKYFSESLMDWFARKFVRVIVIDDETPIDAGLPAIKPTIVRGELISHYKSLVSAGICENESKYIELLVVERNKDAPNRIDIKSSPDFANPLFQLAILTEFYLEF